jgi:hypothetical protein
MIQYLPEFSAELKFMYKMKVLSQNKYRIFGYILFKNIFHPEFKV